MRNEENMDTSRELLELFLQYANNDAELTRRNNRMELMGYDHSELNCIDCIGTMDAPNVTAIAARMHMTRGGISKIIRKLQDKQLIDCYQLPENRKKIFYTLTDAGKTLLESHRERHKKWELVKRRFFDSLSEEERKSAIVFMRRFNEYLNDCLQEKSVLEV